MVDKTVACRNIEELNPKAQIACHAFVEKCKKDALNVLITETYRPQERQNYLYEQGRTRPGSIITWTKKSNHTGRMAWDICKNIKGQEYNDTAFFKKCGEIAKSLGITWGGTWNTPDMPHMEITNSWAKPTIPKPELPPRQTPLTKYAALDILIKNGIINTPDYWKNAFEVVHHLDTLIIRMAEKLR